MGEAPGVISSFTDPPLAPPLAATLSLCSCWHVVPPMPPSLHLLCCCHSCTKRHATFVLVHNRLPTPHGVRCHTFSASLSGFSCVGSVKPGIVPSQELEDARGCGPERWCKTNLLQKKLLIVLSSVPTVDLQPALLAFCPSCHYSRPHCAAQLAILSELNVATATLNCERFLGFLFCPPVFSLR